MNALILVGSLMVLMAMRIPVVFALLISSFIYAEFLNPIPLLVLAHRCLGSINTFPLLALPLFILAADIMNEGKIGEEILKFARSLVGHVTGSIGHVIVICSMIFAGISGTITAEAAGLGKLEIPMMTRAGFDKGFTVGLVSASSIIGPIIPPSVQMILYAMIAEQSVGRMFIGGLIPGVIMGLTLMTMVYVASLRRNYPKDPHRAALSVVWSTFKTSFPALVTPIIILGGILTGVFTPTEAGVVAVVYSLVICGFVYRTLDYRRLIPMLVNAAVMTALILVIMGAASVFGWLVTQENVPILLRDLIRGMTDKQWVVLLLLNISFLLAGCFFDICAIILVFTPMILPLLQAYQIDMVHWGVVEVLNVCIGFLTPPFGVGLFIMADLNRMKVQDVIRSVVPFLIPLLFTLALITYVPALVTWLPNLVFAK